MLSCSVVHCVLTCCSVLFYLNSNTSCCADYLCKCGRLCTLLCRYIRETETDRQTDRQTETHTQTETERQGQRHTHRERQTDRNTHRQTERDRDIDRDRDRDRDRETERERERESHFRLVLRGDMRDLCWARLTKLDLKYNCTSPLGVKIGKRQLVHDNSINKRIVTR